ncbi:MAG: C-GCAxxG-C-C family protein [Candidatus Coproplasma sp.]
MTERVEKAMQLFLNGYNCAQAVVGAYADLFGMDEQTAMRFAEGLGGGMGRMRLTCGAVSATALLAGLKMSNGTAGDLQTRSQVYEKVRRMAEEFKDKNGSVICGDLLGLNKPADNSSMPEKRTEQYYKKRPCVQCVVDCAEIVEKYLLGEQ